MRQMFTSPRLENVEAVARLFNEAGIETKITEGRTYKGYSRRQFSYTDKNPDNGQQPAVWVLRAEDYKKARDLLHEGGLLESTRQEPSYLPGSLQAKANATPDPARRLLRIRMVLLALIGGMVALMLLRTALA
jgi:hypothetical protein